MLVRSGMTSLVMHIYSRCPCTTEILIMQNMCTAYKHWLSSNILEYSARNGIFHIITAFHYKTHYILSYTIPKSMLWQIFSIKSIHKNFQQCGKCALVLLGTHSIGLHYWVWQLSSIYTTTDKRYRIQIRQISPNFTARWTATMKTQMTKRQLKMAIAWIQNQKKVHTHTHIL